MENINIYKFRESKIKRIDVIYKYDFKNSNHSGI